MAAARDLEVMCTNYTVVGIHSSEEHAYIYRRSRIVEIDILGFGAA
jgi:hypothetical protein